MSIHTYTVELVTADNRPARRYSDSFISPLNTDLASLELVRRMANETARAMYGDGAYANVKRFDGRPYLY